MWVHKDRLEASQAEPPAITMNEDVVRGEKDGRDEWGVCYEERWDWRCEDSGDRCERAEVNGGTCLCPVWLTGSCA